MRKNLNLALADFSANGSQPAVKKETTWGQCREAIFGPFIQHPVSGRMMVLTSIKHLLSAYSVLVPGLGTFTY